MVYPVSGGIAQQIPAANTFQPGAQATENKNQAQENRLDSTKLSGTETARSQETNTKNFQRNESYSETGRTQDTGGVSANASRGTSVDITV